MPLRDWTVPEDIQWESRETSSHTPTVALAAGSVVSERAHLVAANAAPPLPGCAPDARRTAAVRRRLATTSGSAVAPPGVPSASESDPSGCCAQCQWHLAMVARGSARVPPARPSGFWWQCGTQHYAYHGAVLSVFNGTAAAGGPGVHDSEFTRVTVCIAPPGCHAKTPLWPPCRTATGTGGIM